MMRPILCVSELIEAIRRSTPPRNRNKTITRVFQAIMIAVNGELEKLDLFLSSFNKRLCNGGRITIISFHSLEDRIVKRFMKSASLVADQYRGMPEVPDDYKPKLKIIGKAIKSKVDEISHNIRSRSAVLRVAERL